MNPSPVNHPDGLMVIPNGASAPVFNADRLGNVTLAGRMTITGATTLAAPSAPVITQFGAAGTTAYSYRIVALMANGQMTPVSLPGSTALGNATLDGSNYNLLTWTAYAGASQYLIYRTASAGTPSSLGYLFTVSTANTSDQGSAADTGQPVPTGGGGGSLSIDFLRVGPYSGDAEVRVGINGDLSVNGSVRSTNQDKFTSGVGAELQWNGTAGYVIVYDRDNTAWKPLTINYGATAATGAVSIGSDVTADVTNMLQLKGSFYVGNATTFTTGVQVAHDGTRATIISNTGEVRIYPSVDAGVSLGVNSVLRWQLENSAQVYCFSPSADNAYDLGRTALQVRSGYFGTSLVVDAMASKGVTAVQAAAQFDVTSSTALVNVTGLSVTVKSAKVYRFEALLYTTSNVAGGVKFAIAGTATATSVVYEGLTISGGLMTQTRGTAMAATVGAITAVTAAAAWITGTITVNAGGTLTVQFAQNASNGTASSILIGSSFNVQQV